MRRLLGVVLLAQLAWACAPEPPSGGSGAQAREQPVVYGQDDRQEVYAHPDPQLRELASRSVVVLVTPGSVDRRDPARLTLRGETLQEGRNLCAGQPFASQVQGSRCSGTLISEDLVLTAGHCVDTYRCDDRLYLFGWYLEAAGETPTFTEADVYRCAEVVAHHYTESGLDYAVVRLDRPVDAARRPAPVRAADAPLEVGSSLTLIGAPNGIPVKIAGGGRVVASEGVETFQATVDAFGGNSGSGVFDASGEVVGVLVRGADDYRYPGGGCGVVNTLDEQTRDGEDVVYVARALERVCATRPEEPFCARPGAGTWCAPCEDDGGCAAAWRCVGHPLASSARSCAPACVDDAGCRSDHACGPEGRCVPRAALSCAGVGGEGEVRACVGAEDARCEVGEAVWSVDACGRPLVLEASCGAAGRCSEGACVARPPGDTCALATPLEPVSQLLHAELIAGGYGRSSSGSCGGRGAEAIYRVEVAEATVMTAFAVGGDTVLYLRGASCEDAAGEVACDDDSDPPGSRGSRLEASLAPGVYHLVVDTFDAGVEAVDVALSFGPAACGEAGCFSPGRCVAAGQQVCAADAAGCLGWSAPAACQGEASCLAGGVCGEPAAGDVCATALPIAAEAQVIAGALEGAFGGSYAGSCGGEDGAEAVYTFALERSAALRASVRGYDSVLYLRSACEEAGSEVACNDDADDQERGSTLLATLGPGRYSLFVDAYDEDVAPYALELFFASTCQDRCAPGEAACDARGARACGVGADGCLGFVGAPEACDGAACAVGSCDASCVDACDPGSRRCDGATVEVCAASSGGCARWEPSMICPQRCEAGTCLGADNEVVGGADARFGEVSGGGCAQGGPRRGGEGAWLLGVVALLYRAWRRRS